MDCDNGTSILLKFQQLSKEREEASSQITKKKAPCIEAADGSDIEESVGEKRKKSSDSEDESETLHKGISEEEVGITEYVSTGPGFIGIIKHRFSDFQVHEIDLQGNTVVLTSKELPKKEEKELDLSDDASSVLSNEQWKGIEENVESESKEPYEIDVTDKTKPERAALHKAIKLKFGPSVFSNSKEKDGRMMLQIGKCLNNPDRRSWPVGRGNYLHFTVFKENMDSTQTVNLLSVKLKVRPSMITFAGTKDKRGKTTQRMCVKQKPAEDAQALKLYKIHLGNFKYENHPLRLGHLSGNLFEIAIRNVKASDDVINDALNALKENGFINYFGLQRFGSSPTVPTYLIGKALISSNWKKAVELILMPKPGERGCWEVKKACKIWKETKDLIKSLKVIPKYNSSIEARVMRGLKRHGPNDYLNAIMTLPKNTVLLYLHSYQSLIWNKIVSRRINKYGLKPIVGDLVVDEGAEEVLEESSDNEGVPEQELNSKRMKVRAITEDEVESISIDQIVYPLPGCDVEYPKNETASWFEELLKEDDLTHDCFRNTTRSFSLHGTYRKILTKVDYFSWEIVHYNDFGTDLILSDIDKINGVTLTPQPPDSKYKAVIVRVKLSSSMYATMLLREVMKCGTSSSYHASLTNTDHNSQNKKPKPDTTEQSS